MNPVRPSSPAAPRLAELGSRLPAPEQPEPEFSQSPPVDSLAAPSPAAMNKALQRAQARFGRLPGAIISVSADPASNNLPVVLVRHKDTNSNSVRFTVQTHFHGWQMYDKQEHYETRIGDAVAAAWAHDTSRLFVFPESVDEGTGSKVDWSNIRNLTRLTQKALETAALSWNSVALFVISGHSAGGQPISEALNRAMKGQEPAFGRTELYDAVMNSSEPDTTRAYIHAHTDTMLYVPGVMNTPWTAPGGIPPERRTPPAKNHFDALWSSLGQLREPG